MASERLQVILQMVAGQYKREAKQASSATGRLTGSMGTAGTATSKLDKQLGNTGFTMRNAVTAGAAVAGAAVIGFAKDSIRAATDLEESINAVRVVFGEAADDVLAIGENSADSFGLANSEFNAFAVRFSAFAKNIAEGEGREVGDVIEEMTGRIADFASVMNLDVAEAAEKFQSGLAGEVEPLRKFGINVSAAATSQRALKLGLADTTSELTEGDKVLARYDLLMEQTNDTAGDFKNTQDGLANATRTLNANMEDFKARAGDELTPVMGELAAQGIRLFDILDPDVNLGWTQRLSAGIQLVTGEGSEAVKTYIEQKTASNDLETAAGELTAAELAARDAFADVAESSTGAAGGIDEVGSASGSSAGEVEILTDRASKLHGAWDDVVTSMEDYETMIRRLTDPVFAAVDDQRALEEATQRYLDIIDDPDATVGEQERAMWDLVEAQRNAEASAADLPEDLQAAIDHIVILGDRAGITDEHLQILRDTIMEFDGLSAQSTIGINVVGGEQITGLDINRDITLRHSGGPVEAGRPYNWRPGEEMFIPQQNGFITSRSDTDRLIAALQGGGADINVNLQGTGDPEIDAQRVGSMASVLRRMETI